MVDVEKKKEGEEMQEEKIWQKKSFKIFALLFLLVQLFSFSQIEFFWLNILRYFFWFVISVGFFIFAFNRYTEIETGKNIRFIRIMSLIVLIVSIFMGTDYSSNFQFSKKKVVSFERISGKYQKQGFFKIPFVDKVHFKNKLKIDLVSEEDLVIKKVETFSKAVDFLIPAESFQELKKDKDYNWWKNKSKLYFKKKFKAFLNRSCKKDKESNTYYCSEDKIKKHLILKK